MGRYLEAAKVVRAAMDAAAAALTDEQALKAAAIYPLWNRAGRPRPRPACGRRCS